MALPTWLSCFMALSPRTVPPKKSCAVLAVLRGSGWDQKAPSQPPQPGPLKTSQLQALTR